MDKNEKGGRGSGGSLRDSTIKETYKQTQASKKNKTEGRER